ncbi:myosin light chain kinase, smooth muscle-like isoform X2 [Dermacentor silvarum]|uniref:myosin light chain kinase, smooth muscle-like isoform X2 n=1 Tax=Dermacentor silvarum TaxID=543639 RepID=UPI002101429E|nr:myosin light chain kinase, smooth muscle-like isoform X2 [Dermacentor silvarum]
MSAASASRVSDSDCLDSVNARQNGGELGTICDPSPDTTETLDLAMVPSGQTSQVIVVQECDGPHTVAYPQASESSHQINKDPYGLPKGDVELTETLLKTADHRADLGADDDSVRLSCNGADPLPAKIVRGPESVVAVIGGHVHLGVLFVGTPPPRVTWTKGGKSLLPAGDRVHVSSERRCSSELRIRDACCDDSGKYQVVVENSLGSDSGFASVKVEGPPDPPAEAPRAVALPGGAIEVTWSCSPFDGGCRIQRYLVDASPASAQPRAWSRVAAVLSTCCRLADLPPATAYVFVVRAQNARGLSMASAESPPAAPMPPDGPSTAGRGDDGELDDEITEPPGLPVTMRPGEEFSQNYHVHESVGRGRFGVVHRCTRLADGTDAAAKMVRCTRAAERDRMRHELAILNLLRGHPRLLRLLDAYEKPREIILVTEYVSGGELFERVIADDFVLTEWDCVLFLRQICAGMAYMHSRHVIHLDLKPENILCQSQVGHKIKLIDFGLAQLYEPNSSLRVMFGTPEFVAPEVVSYEPVSPATDMWSVGVICYVLLSGLSPFMGDSDTDTFNNIVRVDFDFDDPVFETISAVAKDFMCQLIVKNPRHRMSAEQCLEHEWLCVVPKRGASSLPLPTDKLKKFVVRRKWLKSGNALKALSRMTNMSGQRPAAQGDEASVLLACEEDAPVSPPPCDTAHATVEEEDSSAGDN